jgi:hypothetical protein
LHLQSFLLKLSPPPFFFFFFFFFFFCFFRSPLFLSLCGRLVLPMPDDDDGDENGRKCGAGRKKDDSLGWMRRTTLHLGHSGRTDAESSRKFEKVRVRSIEEIQLVVGI